MNAPSADPGLSFDVTEADFRQTVLERSLDVPVLLDCWAPWCGPCRNLKPVLEKLVQEYGGRFVLAKINTDDAPQISAALQIRSIPLVVLFVGGRPADQFQGALPEGQVRAFLEKHLGQQVSEAEALRTEAAESPDPQHAEMLLSEALRIEPANAEVALDLATRYAARFPKDPEILDAVARLSLANAKLGAVHGLAGVIGGLTGAAHGLTCATLLVECCRGNVAALRDRAPEDPALARYAEAGELLSGTAGVDALLDWLAETVRVLEVPTIGQLGVTPEQYSQICTQAAASSSMKGNPIMLSADELEEILRRSA